MVEDMMVDNQKIDKIQMNYKNNEDKKIGNLTIRIDKTLLDKYKDLCESNGYDMSKRLRLLIQAELDFNDDGVNLLDKIKKRDV